MYTVIFGRPGCPYCVRAKELAEKLKMNVKILTTATLIFKLKVFLKKIYLKPLANLLKPFHKFLLMSNTLVDAQISKLMQKKI